MLRLTKVLRPACSNIKHSKKISSSSNVQTKSYSPCNAHSHKTISNGNFCAARQRVPPYHHLGFCTDANLEHSFEKACDETLESLTEFFEELVESRKELENADISYSSGVLNVNLGKYGTYVINRQSPNKQIWLSSPTSGPKRYDYIAEGSCWIYKYDKRTLHQLLEDEISIILGDKIDMSKCAYFKIL
nr:frataxin homolog, mitochondrial [Leptinotarsa decemlineata]